MKIFYLTPDMFSRLVKEHKFSMLYPYFGNRFISLAKKMCDGIYFYVRISETYNRCGEIACWIAPLNMPDHSFEKNIAAYKITVAEIFPDEKIDINACIDRIVDIMALSSGLCDLSKKASSDPKYLYSFQKNRLLWLQLSWLITDKLINSQEYKNTFKRTLLDIEKKKVKSPQPIIDILDFPVKEYIKTLNENYKTLIYEDKLHPDVTIEGIIWEVSAMTYIYTVTETAAV